MKARKALKHNNRSCNYCVQPVILAFSSTGAGGQRLNNCYFYTFKTRREYHRNKQAYTYDRTAQQLEYLKNSIKSIQDYPNPAFFSAMSPAYWKTRKLTL